MKRRFKILAAMVVASVIGIAVAAVVYLSDDPPPEDSDLKVQRHEIADAENGMTAFEEMARAIVSPSDDKTRKQSDACAPEGDWDAAVAEKLVQDNAKAFALWEEGMACRATQASEPGTIADLHPAVFQCLTMGNLLATRSRLHQTRGENKEAIEDAFRLCEFGRRVDAAKGVYVQYMVGMTITGIGLERLQHIAAETPMAPEDLKACAARLAPYQVSEEALADALRAEYATLCNTVLDVLTGKKGVLNNIQQSGGMPGPAFFYTFKPNRTRARIGRTIRVYMLSIPKTYLHSLPEIVPVRQEEYRRRQRWIATKLLSPNMVGDTLDSLLLPALHGFPGAKCKENVWARATQTILAIRAFQKARGHLPEKLEELVPEFLAAVPADDFDGKPLRWSKAKQVVYSVGEDLVDDGGDESQHFVGIPLEMDKEMLAQLGFKDPLADKITLKPEQRHREPRDIVFHLDPKDAPKDE